MSAVVEHPAPRPTDPVQPRSGFGSLLRSELHRFRSRRFIQVVLALAVVGWIVITGIALTQYGNPGADEIARAELLTESRTIVEADDLAGLDAALCRAGLATHPADGDRRLVEAEPEVVARAVMADGVVLRRLVPAEGAGLERLFFELTASGASTPSTQTDAIHPELQGATA